MRLRGVALAADDVGWRHSAAEVRGPALAVAVAVLGRWPAFSAVTGDGAGVLAGRCS